MKKTAVTGIYSNYQRRHLGGGARAMALPTFEGKACNERSELNNGHIGSGAFVRYWEVSLSRMVLLNCTELPF